MEPFIHKYYNAKFGSKDAHSIDIEEMLLFVRKLDSLGAELSKLRNRAGCICYSCETDTLYGRYLEAYNQNKAQTQAVEVEIAALWSSLLNEENDDS